VRTPYDLEQVAREIAIEATELAGLPQDIYMDAHDALLDLADFMRSEEIASL